MTEQTLRPLLVQAIEQGQQLYAVLNKTCESQPEQHFSSSPDAFAEPLWLDTAYREWLSVMPVCVSLQPDDPFVDWVEQAQPADWGMFVLSPFDFQAVYQHFRSLTQIWLPDGSFGFFRFFDPRFAIRIAQLCDPVQQSALMGPTSAWLSYGQQVYQAEPAKITPEQDFPWWALPNTVAEALAAEDHSALAANLLTDLADLRPDLAVAFRPSLLDCKVHHFIAGYTGPADEKLANFIRLIEQDLPQYSI